MKLEHINKSFGGQTVLDDISYEFQPGVTAIMGPSGVGKSTLLAIICGLQLPDSGRVVRAPDEKAGVVFQEDRLIEDRTAMVNLMFVSGKENIAQARSLLEALGLGDGMDKPVREYSGGMKRRVAIARALIYRPDILIMDEPFRGLDAETRAVAAGVIRQSGIKSIIFVTHDPAEIELMGAEHVMQLGQ